jgi:hypothetical protein
MLISKQLIIGIFIGVLVSVAVFGFVQYSVATNLQNQLNLLQNRSTQLETNYTDLQAQTILLQNRASELETNYITLKTGYTELQTNYTKLQGNYTVLQANYTDLKANYTGLYNQLHPTLQVTYWKNQPGEAPGAGSGIQYFFNITGTLETFQLAPSAAINQALAPLVSNYPFVTMVSPAGLTIPYWTNQYVGSGQFSFTLLLKSELTGAQLLSLTQDLGSAFKSL